MLNLVEYQSIDTVYSYNNDLRDILPESQGTVQDDYTIEWLDNPKFETPIDPWYNTTEGDASDINATTVQEQANYDILGGSYIFSNLSGVPQAINWVNISNPVFPVKPDTYIINEQGFRVEHIWDENVNQTRNAPSARVKRDIELPINMSNYIITSASFSATFNASVVTTPEHNGIDTPNDPTSDFATGDHATFYVLLSDVAGTQEYQVAYNQTVDLGQDSGPEIDNYPDTLMNSVPQDILIAYLTSILAYDNFNFSVILGIDIYCEDNNPAYDEDRWTYLIIREVNLTFTCEKKIDQFTSLSWNQIGDTISGANIDIKNATLNFKYKIDNTWTEQSPNSELRFFINNNQYPETVKLSTATSIFQDAKVGGFDVTNLILKNVNITLSIQLYLADTFPLDQKFTLSIDNASLLISYTETTIEDATNLEIFLNSEDKTLEKSIDITMGYDVNVTVIYKDSGDSYIPGATVRLLGTGGPWVLNEDMSFNQYSAVFSSNELSLGNNFLTIEANKTYYEPITELINIKVIERDTELKLFLDEADKTLDKSIEMIYGNNGNISITYKDVEQLPGTHIDGATVELIGIGGPQNLTEDLPNSQYFIIIDTMDLGLGNSFLTVNAYEENYTTQSIRFKIEVTERDTKIDVYLNGTLSSNFEFYNTSIGEKLNITAFYKDLSTNSFINDANVRLFESGIPTNLTESLIFNQYNITINIEDLGVGVKFLTIHAIKDNYTMTSEVITLIVNEKKTQLLLFLNGSQYYYGDTVELEVTDTLNITVKYLDNLTKEYLGGADVDLINQEYMTENASLEHYNITIKVSDLNSTLNRIVIRAQVENYQTALIEFFIQIVERGSTGALFINELNKTADPYIELTIGSLLNLTIKYSDIRTENHISGAIVQLNGDLTGLLSEYIALEQYSIIINTTDLGVGLNIFTVIAEKANFELFLIQKLYVSVARIRTNITTTSGESNLVARPGESVNLSIVITNLDFGGTVKEANVTYRWAFGEGFLTDNDNDGIYTVLLTGMPEGSFTFTINAYKGEEYDFTSYDLVISVIRPAEEILLFQILMIISSIAAASALIYLYLYKKVLKFPKPVRKVRKYRKTLKKAKDPKVKIMKREKAFNTAYGTELDNTSKLLKGKIEEPVIKPQIPFKKPVENPDK